MAFFFVRITHCEDYTAMATINKALPFIHEQVRNRKRVSGLISFAYPPCSIHNPDIYIYIYT